MSNYVILKGRRDRLTIYLDPDVELFMLKDDLIKKVKEAENFIGEAHTAIEFANRELSEEEENILLDAIQKNTKIKISYVFSGQEDQIIEQQNFLGNILDEGITKFYKGTLRSGHNLEFNGNIVILGDVNPGAYVKARGNILILGHLNGTAYAGSENENDAFVGALSMKPIQIKIGEYMAKNPSQEILDTNRVKKTTEFEIAYLKEGRIFIESFNKKTLENMLKI
ncbi:septum site-determining protein MinC [Cetobacterium sp. SF1]|uniref:septum site-determining protein MinC n=1 Tax=unclassified Cetobacterium TaxID=2630983 RepID=UPI003CE8D8C0